MKIRVNKAAKKVIFGLILVFGTLHIQSHSVEAARIPNTVDVRLPSFQVTLNTYNPIPQNESYPPIVYNDITYIAMTWNNCQRLNLFINWSEESGLSISKKTEGRSSFPFESIADVDNDLQTFYQATIPSYKITVNGKSIDNSREAYPILSFRTLLISH
jgi:hypothetical protein